METILTKTDNHSGIILLLESDVVQAWWANNSVFQEGITSPLAYAETLENVLLAYCVQQKKKIALIKQRNPIIIVSVTQSVVNHGRQKIPPISFLVSASNCTCWFICFIEWRVKNTHWSRFSRDFIIDFNCTTLHLSYRMGSWWVLLGLMIGTEQCWRKHDRGRWSLLSPPTHRSSLKSSKTTVPTWVSNTLNSCTGKFCYSTNNDWARIAPNHLLPCSSAFSDCLHPAFLVAGCMVARMGELWFSTKCPNCNPTL